MNALTKSFASCALLTLFTIVAATQETKKLSAPTPLVICISGTSDRARIQQSLPRLLETIARDQTKASQRVSVVALRGPHDAMEQARSANCDYLLDLKVFQRSIIEVTKGPEQNRAEREQFGKNVEGEINVRYKVLAVHGAPVDIQNEIRVHEMEYPLENDPTAFDTVVFRATSSAADQAIKKLKKMKSL